MQLNPTISFVCAISCIQLHLLYRSTDIINGAAANPVATAPLLLFFHSNESVFKVWRKSSVTPFIEERIDYDAQNQCSRDG